MARKQEKPPIAFRSQLDIKWTSLDAELAHARAISLNEGKLMVILQTRGQIAYLGRVAPQLEKFAHEMAKRARALRDKAVLALKGENVHNFRERTGHTGARPSIPFQIIEPIIGEIPDNNYLKWALFISHRGGYCIPRAIDHCQVKRIAACMNAIIIACIGEYSEEESQENAELSIPQEWYNSEAESAMPPEYQWDLLTADPLSVTDTHPNEPLYFPGTEGGRYCIPGIETAQNAITRLKSKAALRTWKLQNRAIRSLLLTKENPDYIPPGKEQISIKRDSVTSKNLKKVGIELPGIQDVAGNEKSRKGTTYEYVETKIKGSPERKRACLFPVMPLTTQVKATFQRIELRLTAIDQLLQMAILGLKEGDDFVEFGDQKIPIQSDEHIANLVALHRADPTQNIKKATLGKAWVLIRKAVMVSDVPFLKFYSEEERVERVQPTKKCITAWEENGFGYPMRVQEKALYRKRSKNRQLQFMAAINIQEHQIDLSVHLNNLLDLLDAFGETQESLAQQLSILGNQNSSNAKIIKQKLALLKKAKPIRDEELADRKKIIEMRRSAARYFGKREEEKSIAEQKAREAKERLSKEEKELAERERAERELESELASVSRPAAMNERPLEAGAIRVIGTHANARYFEQGKKRLKKIERERRQAQEAALAIHITDKQSAMLFLQTLRPKEAKEIATMVRGGMDPTDIALRDRQKLYEEINGRNRSNNGS